MAGVNRFYVRGAAPLFEKEGASLGPCVFISHQFQDLSIAKKVGDQLKALEIDIWLDVDDPETQRAIHLNDELKLAEAIERGLTNCTDLLALISPNTKESWWVPYEIGAARAWDKQLAFLVHKNVNALPSYLAFARQILDQSDFYKWTTGLLPQPANESQRIIRRLQKDLHELVGPNLLDDILPRTRR